MSLQLKLPNWKSTYKEERTHLRESSTEDIKKTDNYYNKHFFNWKLLKKTLKCYEQLISLYHSAESTKVDVIASLAVSINHSMSSFIAYIFFFSGPVHSPEKIENGMIHSENKSNVFCPHHGTASRHFGIGFEKQSVGEITWLSVTASFSKRSRFKNVFHAHENERKTLFSNTFKSVFEKLRFSDGLV